jgi:D-alanyl-D-alanine carboxypeptidase/D-alanyl-D-alanine-endopeptidase (penicillin-binding protein 4)
MKQKQYMTRNLYLIIILLTGLVNLNGQNEKMQSNIDRILASKELKYSNITMTVMDIEGDSIEASINPYTMAIPASSLKVITTLCAVDILGADYEYETTIAYDGTIQEGGTLKGNVYIIGSGDPTLGAGKFEGNEIYEELLTIISNEIKGEGITCIDGKIISDESIYNSFPIAPTWQWNDLGNYYASGAWGINVNENKYTIYFSDRGTVGRRPTLKSHYPTVNNIEFSNEVAVDSAHTGDQAYIFGGPYDYTKRIVGTIPSGEGTFAIKGSIPEPPKFLAYKVEDDLKNHGIQTLGYDVIFTPHRPLINETVIHQFKSPTVTEIVKRANLESNNLYTESLLKSMGFKVRKSGSGQLGISAINRYLNKLKVNHDCLVMHDGSGLSARNNVCSYMMADFLRAYVIKNGFEQTASLLPIGGRTGTVRGLFKQSGAAGNVYVKSGSMSSVQSYTGIMMTKSGKQKAFSLIVNGFSVKGSTIRAKLEKVMKEIYLHG